MRLSFTLIKMTSLKRLQSSKVTKMNCDSMMQNQMSSNLSIGANLLEFYVWSKKHQFPHHQLTQPSIADWLCVC
ncbi:unnamed protein product [Clavelina lepadiformis]|uniref:Uncharacterized protein n=1 Tax=Clavelina lepadiformis TaxID=159417 RepID=A0ABP0GWD2_CLALP